MRPETRAIRYPFSVDANRGGVALEDDYEEYVGQLIRQTLLTAQGERINQPAFGAGIRRLIFGLNSTATASLAQTMVREALETWLGRFIRTEKVEVLAQQEKLLITVWYVIIARGERRFLNVEVEP